MLVVDGVVLPRRWWVGPPLGGGVGPEERYSSTTLR